MAQVSSRSTPAKQDRDAAVYGWLNNHIAPQVARALPKGYSADRFIRAVWTICRADPNLLACEYQSLALGVLNAAQLGLEFGPLGHAYLLPFKDNKRGTVEATLIIGYKGFVDLAHRAGQAVIGRSVCENDTFDYDYGEGWIRHRPADRDRGPLTHTYCVSRPYDASQQSFTVLSLEQIEGRRARSKSPNRGPWADDFEAMATKSSVRAHVPWMRMSPQLAQAEAIDDVDLSDLPDGLGLVVDVEPIEQSESGES